MAKKEELDEETLAFIHWCIEVEKFLVAGGATIEQAQEHIEEQVEWFTDQFYDGLSLKKQRKKHWLDVGWSASPTARSNRLRIDAPLISLCLNARSAEPTTLLLTRP